MSRMQGACRMCRWRSLSAIPAGAEYEFALANTEDDVMKSRLLVTWSYWFGLCGNKNKEIHLKVRGRMVFCLLAVLLIQGFASAEIIDTLSQWTGGSLDSFGELSGNNPGAVTFGQTFTLQEGPGYLTSVSFSVLDYYPSPASDVCTFKAYVMAWEGLRPTGPVLYESQPLTTSGSLFGYETFTIGFDGPPLGTDQEYILFFSANEFLNGIRSDAAMASVGNTYPGGGFYDHYGGFSFNDLLTQDWNQYFANYVDVAVRIELMPVPEPGTVLLLGLGGLATVRRPRCRG